MKRALVALFVSTVLSTSTGCHFLRVLLLGCPFRPCADCGPCGVGPCGVGPCGGCGLWSCTGCGEWPWRGYFAAPRAACEPCDMCGNWIGPHDGYPRPHYGGYELPHGYGAPHEGQVIEAEEVPQPTPARQPSARRGPTPARRYAQAPVAARGRSTSIAPDGVKEGDVIYESGGRDGEIRDIQWSESRVVGRGEPEMVYEEQPGAAPARMAAAPRRSGEPTPAAPRRRGWSPDRPGSSQAGHARAVGGAYGVRR